MRDRTLSAKAYSSWQQHTDTHDLARGILSRWSLSLGLLMGNATTENDRPLASVESGEAKLRGTALDGSEQKRAADHARDARNRNPDSVVRVDGEEDTLYTDGLDLEDDPPPMGTSSCYDESPE